jgi:uncharacterized protein (DUF924 family)/Ran GTPase-activating protein (RanGAP) involved in mRNA processing and transport
MQNPNNKIESILRYWFHNNEWRGGLWFHGIDESAIDTSKSGVSQKQAKKSAQSTTDQFILKTFGPIIDEIMTEEGNLKVEYEPTEWKTTMDGRIALIILLDQLTRNSYRGTSKMFFFDRYASSIARTILDEQSTCISPLLWNHRLFLFICLTHSEQESDVNRAAIGLTSLINEFTERHEDGHLIKKVTRVLHATEAHLTVLQRYSPLNFLLAPLLFSVHLLRFGRYPHRNLLLGRENTPAEEEYLKGPLPTWARSVGSYHSSADLLLSVPATETSETEPPVPLPSRPARKPSILVLHSSKQNPVSFIKATRKMFGEESPTSLGYYTKLSVLPATHSYTPIGEAKDSLEGIDNPTGRYNRCWWNATDDPSTMIYEGLEETIAYVNRYCQMHGPFDGILGFSQGGCLAGILAHLQQIQSPLVKDCHFQFVVIISGFACRDIRPEFNMSTRPPIPISLPSYHCWGLADSLVINPRSECLANWFVNPVVKTHVGGHFFGAINLWPVTQIIQWISSLDLSPSPHSAQTESDSEASQALSFDEKFELTKSKNQFLFSSNLSYASKNYQSNKKRGDLQLLQPFGLCRCTARLLQQQQQQGLWRELVEHVPLHDKKHFTREMIDEFVTDLVKSCEGEERADGERQEDLLSDLALLAFCLYPFPEYAPHQERSRSKHHRLTVQGEVFYWLYLRLLQLALDPRTETEATGEHQGDTSNINSRNELVRFYLEKLVEIGDWNDLFRLDLLLCSGTSVKIIHSDPPSSTTASAVSLESHLPMIPKKSELALTNRDAIIHEIFINLIVSRLCLDIQILKSKATQAESVPSASGQQGEDGTGGAGDDYDELVVKKLDLSLENDEMSSSLTRHRQRVSDCVKYCPRWKSYTERSTGLTSLIAHRLYNRMNGSGLVAHGEVSDSAGEGEDRDPAEERTGRGFSGGLLHVSPICRNYYRQVIRQLSEHHSSLALLSKDNLSLIRAKENRQWRVKAYATCSEEEYQALVTSTPLSIAILHPEPEPVDVATSEEMSQLYQFFQTQHEEHTAAAASGPSAAVVAAAALLKNDQIFDKGTLCSDGRLDLCKQVVGPNGVSSLMNSLLLDSTGKHQVQHLLLGNNICGDGLGEAVATFIKSGKSHLTTWYIAGNRLSAEGIRFVCEALGEDRQVTQLWLKRNPLHGAGARHLGDMLLLNSSLLVLDLVNTGLLDEGGLHILSALSGYTTPDDNGTTVQHCNSTLQHLYLDGNGFTLTFAQELARYFLSSSGVGCGSGLVTLSVGCNRFGNKGVELICSSLLHNTTLQRLCLASVGMGSAGGHAVAALLRNNSSLRHLDLGLLKFTAAAGEIPNRIGTEGAVAIAHALKYFNNSLFSLQLLNNLIFQTGMSALRAALFDSASADSSAADSSSPEAVAVAMEAISVSPVTSTPLQQPQSHRQTMNKTLVRLDLEQMGVPFNELTREEIRLALRRNYLAMTEEQRRLADEAVVPNHLGPIQSVYRVNGSYTK